MKPTTPDATQAALRAEVKGLLQELFLIEGGESLQPHVSLLENGVLDSTGVLELVAELELRYGIDIADEEIIPENLDSIDCMVRFLRTRRSS